MKSPAFHTLLAATAALFAASLQAQAPVAPAGGQNPGAPQVPNLNQPQDPANAGGRGAQAGAPAGRGGAAGGRGGLGDAGIGTSFTPDFTKQSPILPKTPAEELKHFILKPGYRMELVLSDPVIEESAAIAFDGNGRMFVLELRGYMNDVAATGTRDPSGRISLHDDVDGDGVYEKHSVFVDNLIFPRFVLPFGKDTILTAETDKDEIWKFTDTNGDGKADKQELFATGFGRFSNVEHQMGFMTWALDNWLYTTVNAFRIRWTPNGILKEPTGSNGSHWGVTQDNDGKTWYQASATGLPGYFQFPIHYGTFNSPEQFLPTQNDFLIAWGAPVRVADMQGGVNVTRMPDGSLNSMTGAAGNDIVRGHRMPADIQGDYIYGEPIGRMLRRNKVINNEGVTQIQNAHLYDEFLKSTDPLFRPVDITTAPDGTLYITDMYRGIIQEAGFLGGATSYIRQRIDQYALDKVVDHGRIWRLSHESLGRDKTKPRMLNESAAQLVAHLSHPNGWWRDTAQQLLVLKQDKSVVPALQRLVRGKGDVLGRMHALWTLEGLGALTPELSREMLKDAEPRMRIQAIRASETLYKGGNKTFVADYATLTKDRDNNVAIQAVMTMNTLKVPEAATVIKATQEANKSKGMQLVTTGILNPGAGRGGRGGGGGPGGPVAQNFSAADQASIARGQETYASLCFACHGADGLGVPRPNSAPGVTMAPALAGSPRITGHRDYTINVLLHGLQGPVGGVNFPEVMIGMGANNDQWVADVTNYIRTSFGNDGSVVQPADVARSRAAAGNRTTPWTFAELDTRIPKLLLSNTWKATASHNSATASGALSFTSWTTGVPQQAGMWYQVELPETASLAELQFTIPAPGGGRGGGRGGAGGGRGGAGGAGGGAAGPGAGGAPAAAGPAPVPAVAPAAPAVAVVPAVVVSPSPEAYRVDVSMNGTDWTEAASGAGKDGSNTVAFARATPARFVRITQTEAAANAPAWSMTNLRLLAVAPAAR